MSRKNTQNILKHNSKIKKTKAKQTQAKIERKQSLKRILQAVNKTNT